MAGKKEVYKKDYEVVETLTGQGTRTKKELVYHGKHYSFDVADEELTRLKIKYGAANILCLLFYILMATLPCRSMGFLGQQATAYVILPYVVTVIPMGMMFAKTVMLLTRPRKMEYVDYDKYVVQLRGYTLASVIGAAASALGQFAYIAFLNPEGSVLYELLFSLFGILSAAAGLLYLSLQRKQKMTVS